MNSTATAASTSWESISTWIAGNWSNSLRRKRFPGPCCRPEADGAKSMAIQHG